MQIWHLKRDGGKKAGSGWGTNQWKPPLAINVVFCKALVLYWRKYLATASVLD